MRSGRPCRSDRHQRRVVAALAATRVTSTRRRCCAAAQLESSKARAGAAGNRPSMPPGCCVARLDRSCCRQRSATPCGPGVEPAHRPAAIGFVAVSGLDRLAGNPAEIKRATDTLFAAVDEASSALDVTLISTDVAPDGMKLIIAAGVPATVGDDGERLVIALQRIVAATDRLHVRAGANIGVIFAADVGHPRRRTYTVMGDAVNLSARLAYRADPGAGARERGPRRHTAEPLQRRLGAVVHRQGQATPLRWQPWWRQRVPTQPTSSRPRRRCCRCGVVVMRVRRLRAAVGTSPVIDVFGPAGFGSSRIVSEALDGRHRVTTPAGRCHRQFHSAARCAPTRRGAWWRWRLGDDLDGSLRASHETHECCDHRGGSRGNGQHRPRRGATVAARTRRGDRRAPSPR